MKISARNQVRATVKEVHPGAVNTEVVLEVGPNILITAMISKTSAERLQLKVGKSAYAIIKASDVMVGVD